MLLPCWLGFSHKSQQREAPWTPPKGVLVREHPIGLGGVLRAYEYRLALDVTIVLSLGGSPGPALKGKGQTFCVVMPT